LVGVDDPTLAITTKEYDNFLFYCESKGIAMRQRRGDIEQVYDCTMYGRLCGVGHTNIFISKKGIYPCGRFFGMSEYKLAEYNTPLDQIKQLKPLKNNCCFYEAIKER
jgi:uncharacterized protein